MDDFFAGNVDDIDTEFEAVRRAAQQRVADAENDLLAAQLQCADTRRATVRAARKLVRVAIEALEALEEEWLNDHALDNVAL